MKQLTHNLLKLKFNGVKLTDVSKIEFAFSQEVNEKPLKTCIYPSDQTVLLDENMIGVIWTQEETALFKGGKEFYCDTRITLKNSIFQPETLIVKVKMDKTLFY